MLTGIFAAPLALGVARPEGWFLYQAFEPFCHQHAERSWHIGAYPLAVCVRCLGFYGGLLIAAAQPRSIAAQALVVALAINAAFWAAELAGLSVAGEIRFLLGVGLGFSAGALGCHLTDAEIASDGAARVRRCQETGQDCSSAPPGAAES
jgi:uncharacterized membrane protein